MIISKDLYRLVTTFTKHEIAMLKTTFPSRKSNAYFQYSYFQRNPNFFSLLMYPKNTYVWKHYNAMLSFNPNSPPPEAIEIFNLIPPDRWAVKRLDVACDYFAPLTEGFLLPPPTSAKIQRFGSTIYYGAVNSKCSVCQYDKSKQLDNVYGVQSLHPTTRIEFRFKLNLKPITAYNYKDFAPMSKFHYLPDTKGLTGFRVQLKHLTTGKADWKKLERRRKDKIKNIVRIQAPDMRTVFMEYIGGDIDEFMLSGLRSSFTELPTANHDQISHIAL